VSQLATRVAWSGGTVLITPGRRSVDSMRWSQILAQTCDFCLPHLHSTSPLGAVPVGILPWRLVRKNWNCVAIRWWKKYEDMCSSFDSTECTNVTDGRRADRQTPHDGIGRACIAWQKTAQHFCHSKMSDCHYILSRNVPRTWQWQLVNSYMIRR